MPLLSAELFDGGQDAYGNAVLEIVRDPPEFARQGVALARQIGEGHITDALGMQGLEVERTRWRADLGEHVAVAFILARCEDWSELSAERFRELVDASLEATNAIRDAVGSAPIDAADMNARVSFALLGVTAGASEWQELRDYITSAGAWDRLASVQGLLGGIGSLMAGALESDRWTTAAEIAWCDGIVLALCFQFGELVQREPGEQSGERPLTAELYATDPGCYRLTAAELTSTTAHRVPQVVQGLYWYLAEPLVDPKIAAAYMQWLQDFFECGYVLAVSETWAEFDQVVAEEMIDRGLRRVIAERDTRDPTLLLSSEEYRIRNAAYGFVGESWFDELTAYIVNQSSHHRIEEYGAFLLAAALKTPAIKRRHRDKVGRALAVAWKFGVILGVLDLLGDVPAAMPQRL